MSLSRFLKPTRFGRVPSAAMVVAILLQLPKLSAQGTNPTPLPANHDDFFTKPVAVKPAGAKPIAVKPAATDRAAVHTTGDFLSAPPVEQDLHVTVGRSMFVNTRHRLTRVYVTNPSILDSYTASPNQIVITAKKPGTSSVIVWDEAAESQAFLVTSDVNVTELREALRQAMPNDTVQVSGQEGKIVLTGSIGTAQGAEAATKMATLYSKDVTNAMVVNPSKVKQVTLKCRIVEVDRSKLNAFAFNFFRAQGATVGASSTGQQTSTMQVTPGTSTTSSLVQLTNPLNFWLYNFKNGIGATIQDLQTLNILQILAEPSITAMSGEKGSFLAGGEFPFPIVQGVGSAASITIQFKPYGVKLEFTPTVNVDGTIDLKVAPEVSSLDYTNSVQVDGYTIPALSTRKADTHLVLRSGQTFAISGLLNKNDTDQFAATPGISNIPILGQLFKSKNVNHTAQELVVIVTPTVVDPLVESAIPDEPKLPVPMLDYRKFDTIVPGTKAKP